MRRFLAFILCCFLLSGTVFAADRAEHIRSTSVVYTDGSTDVVLTVTITLDEARPDLTFPLPADAEKVRLNDQEVDLKDSRDNAKIGLVDLGSVCSAAGTYTLTFRYLLPAVLYYEGAKDAANRPLILELPLLSGFEYPVDSMEFSVTFPEGLEVNPSFYSGYLLQSIESDLEYTVNDGVLNGTVTMPMKDKETLMMKMTVDPACFPQLVIVEDGDYKHLYYMAAAGAAALAFWLVFLASPPVLPKRTTAVPAGIHAGEIASRLSMEGADLTAMVFQWAQLGYIHISPDRRGRVWLHKRMEMGNERTPFEMRTFRQLFGSNEMVDGTGSRYAQLWNQVGATLSCADQITTGGLGARTPFRLIAAMASALSGAAMGQNLVLTGDYWQIAVMMAMALAGCITAWKIQAGVACLHLRRRDELPSAILCALLWIIAGLVCRRSLAGLISVGIQIVAGVLYAWGGRRTLSGWQMARQLMGLRHYLTGMNRSQIHQELERNPDYFFQMAPYALAFGVENAFAKRFGRNIMPQCGYLDAPRAEKRTAREWALIMRHTAEKLDNGAKRINQYRG